MTVHASDMGRSATTFPASETGQVAVTEAGTTRVKVDNALEVVGAVRMRVCDDGEGLPEGGAEREPKGASLGMRLVRAMLDQIEARPEVSNARGLASPFARDVQGSFARACR